MLGCGADGAPATQAFCEVMVRGHETGAPPDAEAFEELERVASKEIRDDISLAADLFGAQGSAAFDDPEFQRIEAAIEDWEAENCPSGRQQQ